MQRSFSNLMLWILLACGVATLPLACAGSYDGDTDAARKDAPAESQANPMTRG